MSECVVRMAMPSKNKSCGMAFDFDSIWYCPVKGRICRQPDNGENPSWCPIVCQLPEGHGQLGDLDRLANMVNGARIETMQKGLDTNPYWLLGDIIAQAKTIVPAERSET